jgi:hypothetical protein
MLAAIATATFVTLPVHAELAVSPEAITLAGTRNGDISTTLTLSDRSGIPTLQAAVSDLRRDDGGALIPADKISIEPQKVIIPSDAPAQIKIKTNLTNAAANGEFSGSLYLYYQDGRQVVPLVVRIKAAPLWPWVVMIGGVLLGTALSFYRSEGRARDEIVVQVGRLRTQMRADAKLSDDFQASIESELIDVESAVEDKEWETAKEEILEAKTLWNRWRKGREDWIAQLEDGRTLIVEYFDNLPSSTHSTVYMQEVKDEIEGIYRKLRTGQYEAPQAIKDDFAEVRRMLSQYNEGEAAVKYLREIREAARQLSPAQETYWLNQIGFLEMELQRLSPATSSFQAWKNKLEETKAGLEKEIVDSASTESVPANTRGITGRSPGETPIMAQKPPSGPAISSVFHPQKVEHARRSLRWFNWISRIVAIAFLAWLGMTEIYGSNPTFGADPLRDYFALLAWGFGAELTRESVLVATHDLGLPLSK